MSNLSKEQRAHDLALLIVQLDAENLRANSNENVEFDVLGKYVEYYNDALENLPENLN